MATTTAAAGETHAEARIRNLKAANASRLAAATVKRRLHAENRASAPRLAAELLVTERAAVAGMDIGDYLLAIPGTGKQGAKQLLFRLRISPWLEIRELTYRQEQILVDALHALSAERFVNRRKARRA